MRFNKATVVQVVIVSVLTMLASAPALAQLSAADFLPPAQAKNDTDRAALRDVKQVDVVKTETDAATDAPAVKAGSFQDAINAAAKGIKSTGCMVAVHENNRGCGICAPSAAAELRGQHLHNAPTASCRRNTSP